MKGIIYKWTNIVNGKAYIGQTVREVERIIEHTKANRNCDFHHDIKKYGIHNFDYEVLERDIEEKDLNNRERYYVKLYNTNVTGYNRSRGGDYSTEIRHRVVTQETRDKLAAARTGRKFGPRSEETKQKISESNKGKHSNVDWLHTEEIKDKAKEALQQFYKDNPGSHAGENNSFFGKHHSEETKERLRQLHKGRKRGPLPEETKNKIRAAHKGKKGTNTGRHRVYHEDGSYHYE